MFLDSYKDAGSLVAIDLVNKLAVRPDGRPELDVLAEILSIDPPSVQQLQPKDTPAFDRLAGQLRTVFTALTAGDEDGAASQLNRMLAAHSARPHLAFEAGQWRMHHHAASARLVAMWTSICAEALGRVLADGHGHRAGMCADAACGRVFLDTSRNASRRFCTTTCQNRVKTAALRRRRQHA